MAIIDKAGLVNIMSKGASPSDTADQIIAGLSVLLITDTAQEGYAAIKLAQNNINSDDPDKALFAQTVVSLAAKLQLVTEDRYVALAQSVKGTP